MSDTPTLVSASLTPDTVQSIEQVLATGLEFIFPAAAPVIGMADEAIKKLVPYIIDAINGKKYTLADLRAMRLDLNSFGGSFPNAPGYSNAFAGGASPAPGTVPASVAPISATITLGPGRVITLTADTITSLLAMIGVVHAAVPSVPAPVLTPASV